MLGSSHLVVKEGVSLLAAETSEKMAVDTKQKRPRLRSVISIPGFKVAALEIMDAKSFACELKHYQFYDHVFDILTVFTTGSEDETTRLWNQRNWQAIRFRPRVLVPIDSVDISTTILGNKFSAPFFIAPAGGGKLADSRGEVLLTRGAAKHNVLQWVNNNSGCSQAEIADACGPGQALYWQIYPKANLEISEKEVREAVANGYRGFCLTVDAIRVGKRERALRVNIEDVDLCLQFFSCTLTLTGCSRTRMTQTRSTIML